MAIDAPRWNLGPCASLGSEWIFAHGFGSMAPQDETATVGAATFGIDATVKLTSRFGLRASFDAVVPFSRPGFYIDEVVGTQGSPGTPEPVFHLPPVAARAAVGGEVHF
jgi:hypothetical protein